MNARLLVEGSQARTLLALVWLLHQQPWIVPIPGTKRVERLEENVAASTLELTDTHLADLRAAADQVQIVGARYPEAQDRMDQPGSAPAGGVSGLAAAGVGQ